MSEERDMINEVPGSSPEFRTELAEQLAELVPEAVADGKIDVEKLKELLGGVFLYRLSTPWVRLLGV
ncbi:hypothetical protein CIP107510_01992 [Corynebacterium diphtheriae]|uniref:hypothetical protein n=1 Tax=Corynebacterium diphtheriae TaxID=1717 RepID=UPI0013CB3AC9|nr:hypothetical protein [Corynebacterium diphtheriae]MBG9303321.1 hypothetical protein [Corynebacterium diphtheriae bv. mitis]MBG9305775.1 hypothetical protein [Corynebacterium diphtheriae bv. mitis]CAB0521449.1 hypothetical protein CIP107505_01869 [Corynebacterium diphtheriae]CAB0522106.1 hypothetical protein CIP107502_01917 [Corynebacterium diphtheriae]CAB0568056.1 hypothetical protein CIP107510_01992 [Corynebacterium diphtheriae]